MRDTTKQVLFIHINRTGGTSITAALKLTFEHKTAMEKRQELHPCQWDGAFKFGFVRNPWDKVVSHYFYRMRTNQTSMRDRPISFRDWVCRAYGDRDPTYCDNARMFMPQCDWLCDENGELLVDFVGRFESFESDFRSVQQRLNAGALVDSVQPLPHVSRSQHGRYRDYYDDETRDIVTDKFAADLARFRYRWDAV